MLPVYAAALAVGGTLLLASLVLGHHGADHPGFDHAGGHGDGSAEVGLLASFLSVRFWTFALTFFGLTGLIFEHVVPLEDGRKVLLVSAALGGTIGLAASFIVNKLRSQHVTSVPSEIGYVGLEGEVLLDVTPDEPGRIRVSARGSLIDLPARTESGRLEKGSRALVLDVANGVAQVAPRNADKQT